MFALVVAENLQTTNDVKPDVFFCSVNYKTIDEFVVSVGERLDIAYQSSVGVFCEGVGPIRTCTKIESLLKKISGDELKFLIRFDLPSSNNGIFYAPVIKPKKCRESPRFSHKKFFDSSRLRSGRNPFNGFLILQHKQLQLNLCRWFSCSVLCGALLNAMTWFCSQIYQAWGLMFSTGIFFITAQLYSIYFQGCRIVENSPVFLILL